MRNVLLTRGAAALLVAALLATSARAQQTTILVTPPLQLGNPSFAPEGEADVGVECIAVNTTLQPRHIALQIFDGQGVQTRPPTSPTPTPGPTPTPIPPFQAAILDDPGYESPGSAAAGIRYCMIVVEGSANDVRTTFCLRDAPVGRCTVAVEASELVAPIP
ncbi:MAG: hypothetical protein AB1689_14665 [Thermodesulfobacteriota bacterium]